MKLLIVDDSHEKVQKVASSVVKSNVSVDIVHETNAISARRRLMVEDFDLILIDLQLPEVAGASPKKSGGLEFFDILLLDSKSRLPAEIMFITSEDNLVIEGSKEVIRRGSVLCVVSDTSLEWSNVLAGQIVMASHRAQRRTATFDVAVITALSSELDAVLSLDYGWQKFRIAGDPTQYHRGSFASGQVRCSIVAASPLRKGMAASAALATKLVLKFQPRILTMTGICAGVRGKTNLGDVIVGSPIWDWGSGKHTENDDGSNVFKLSPKQSDLNVAIETLCDEINHSADFRRLIRSNWNGDFPSGEFRCHVGPMASGASVIANASIAEEIAKQNRDLIGIEMEAFAVMVASEYATSNPVLGIAIKSVCDYADKDKQDGWQSYAAYTSAMFADELFKRYFSSL